MLAVVILAAAAAAAQLQASDGFFYETTTLDARVHVIMRPDPVRVPAEGNVTVVEQSDGLIVIDAGGSPLGGRRVVEKIRSISKKPVNFVVFTHWHGDHNLGAPAFKMAYPAAHFISTQGTYAAMTGNAAHFYDGYQENWTKVKASSEKNAADASRPADERARWRQLALDAPLIGKAYAGTKVVPADIVFADRMTFEDPVAPVELMFLGRGNTDGDAVAWLPAQRILVSGDLVVAPYPYGTESYPKEWIDVLKKLEGYNFAYLVPGHGPVMMDRIYIDSVIALIEDMRNQVEPLARQGLSLDDIKTKVNFEPEYRRFAGNDTLVRRFFRQFFVDDMIGCAYKEAKGIPIVQNGTSG
ncbi:MAG TPA: MBL fold metallo-hydrolase [Rhizomicrobium sp.]